MVRLSRKYSILKQTFFVTRYASLWNRLLVNIGSSQTATQFRSTLSHFMDKFGFPHMLDEPYLDQATFKDGPPKI